MKTRMVPAVLVLAALVSVAQPASAAGSATVSGYVYGPGYVPVSGASLVVYDQRTGEGLGAAMTDATGLYSFALTAPACVEVYSSAAGIYPSILKMVSAAAGESLTGVDFFHKTGIAVSGTLVPTSGTLSGTIRVEVYDMEGSFAGWYTYVNGLDGGFFSVKVPAGTWKLVAYSPQFAYAWYGGGRTFLEGASLTVGSVPVTGVVIGIDPVSTIQGTVTAPGGGPAAGAKVYAQYGIYSSSATANASGAFSIATPYYWAGPGTLVRLGATYPSSSQPSLGFENGTLSGYSSAPFALGAGPNAGHSILLPSLASRIAGSYTESGPGSPGIAGAAVVVSDVLSLGRSGPFIAASAPTDAAGSFLAAVRPGRYFVSLSPSSGDYHVASAQGAFVEVGKAPVAASRQGVLGGKIAGAVTKASNPASGAYGYVRVYDLACTSLGGAYSNDSTGTFSSPSFPPGSYKVGFDPSSTDTSLGQVWSGGGTSCATAGSVGVSAAATTTVNLSAPDAGAGAAALTGYVRANGEKGNLTSYASLDFYNVNTGESAFYTYSDQCGAYSIAGLSAGTYSVNVWATSADGTELYGEFPSAFTWTGANQTHHFDLEWTPPPSGRIRGTVLVEGSPREGLPVVLNDSNGHSYGSTRTDRTGRYVFDHVENGSYFVYAISKDGQKPTYFGGATTPKLATPVTIAAGEAVSAVDVNLTEPVGPDPYEPDETGTPQLLVAGTPSEPRSIRDGDDIDWFRFTPVAGCRYGLTVETAVSSTGLVRGVFLNGVADSGASSLWSSSGWLAPDGQARWVALGTSSAGGSFDYRTTLSSSCTSVYLAPLASPLVIGRASYISGSGFTAGSVVKLFVSTSAGAVDLPPITPSHWSSTYLRFTPPVTTPRGDGFVTLLVVNTDQGYVTSNLQSQLLEGDEASGLPTITGIGGTAITPVHPSFPSAYVETVVAAGATVSIDGRGFASPLVNLFTASGNFGPLSPLPGGTATRIQVVVPPGAPTGPGTFQVVNTPSYVLSNAVAAVLQSTISVTSVVVDGSTITVHGTGFCGLSVVNLFNAQPGGVVNLGGLGAGGAPVIPLSNVTSTSFTFTRPAGAVAGPAYVHVLNPPYIPFTSSGTDPGGAFTMP